MSCQSSYADGNANFGQNSHFPALRMSLVADMSIFDFLLKVMPTGEYEVHIMRWKRKLASTTSITHEATFRAVDSTYL